MTTKRILIVNADDFGLCSDVNRGIIEAHDKGIITSASLMVRQPGAREAGAWAGTHPGLSVGLHLDLCEWEYANEEWRTLYEVVPLDDASAVAAEVERQLVLFHDLMGRDPTHIDSHQHVHQSDPVREPARRLAGRLGVPLRGNDSGVRYCGDFYGQSNKGFPYHEGVGVDHLLRILRELPPGMTELACHPAAGLEVRSVYRHERMLEFQTLCDPAVRAAIHREGIELTSFRNVRVVKGLTS